MTKPPYLVPSMKEIAAQPWNGLNIVSTFSGCGGSCLGFKMAGYRVLWANEFVPAAQDTYRANHRDTILDTRDIRTVTGAEILSATGLERGDLDVLEGSPPCASFSTSGSREKAWGKIKSYSDLSQRTDDLFFEYIRLIDELRPKSFVAENVSGLVKGTAKGYFKIILQAMKARGYRVEAKLLDSQWLGVPQARQRIIFVGVRDDIDKAPAFPKPMSYRYTVRDIAPYITALRLGGAPNNWKSSDRPAGTVVQSDGERQTDTAYLSSYQVRDDKHERRKYTIPELKRICGFPDDFELTGSFGQQWERLGRSVPPVMMSHVAKTLYEEVLK